MSSIRARLRVPAPTRRRPRFGGPAGGAHAPWPLAARLAAAALGAALVWPAGAQVPPPAGTPAFPPPPAGLPAFPPPVLPPPAAQAPVAAPAPAAPPPPATRGRGNRVTLNFVNADIEGVTRAVGAILNQQFIVDPRVRGAMTLYSDVPMTPREVYVSFLATLRGLGFTVVQTGGLYKVVPEADAKLQTDAVAVGQPTRRGDQVVTQIFRLVHENANNMVAVLRPLISPNNTINASPGNNSLVITDYADNLQRIAKIIAAMDTPAADVEVIPLRHAVASDMAALVQRVSEGSTAGAAPGAVPGLAGTSVLVDSRSNSLIVRAPNPARLAAIRALVARLDRPTPGGTAAGNNYVVHLRNADAVKLAAVLRATFSAAAQGTPTGATGTTPFGATSPTPTQPTPGTGFGATSGGFGSMGGTSTPATAPLSPSAAPSTGGFVQADPSTNSLVISAPEPLYRQVRAMIDMLDTRRAQVYIESMIVEVTGDNLAEVGFQWQGLIGKPGDNTGVAIGTNSTIAGPSIIALTQAALGAAGGGVGTAGAPALPGPGLNIALIRNFFGTYGLAAIARFLQTQGNTNIVSTPNLITLDNEEAKIIVGSNVPFITGQFTSTGTATTNPFQTIERKDVGITLRIRPQIGESGTVRMAIYQESSSLSTNVAPGTTNAGPSTNKRSIESTVVVDDGAIIVLGGLIEDRFISDQSKVPLLGDIPYIGGLFRSESRTRRRTNLMVFLRPVVLRDSEAQNRLSLDRYDLIRAMQKDSQPRYNPLLPINETGVLPPARHIDAPDPAAPGEPQTATPLAAPQTAPGAPAVPGVQAAPPPPAERGRRDRDSR